MHFEFLKRYAPPGMELRSELVCFIVGICASFFYSMSFLINYFQHRDNLFDTNETGKLIEGAVMEDFYVLLGFDGKYEQVFIGFLITAIVMLGFTILHYSYYRQGSKSIYLMKRLPHPAEIHKRALILPFAAVLCCVIAAFLVMVLYFAIYVLATPTVCLQPAQWSKLWGNLL